jgi:hypothetical protein
MENKDQRRLTERVLGSRADHHAVQVSRKYCRSIRIKPKAKKFPMASDPFAIVRVRFPAGVTNGERDRTRLTQRQNGRTLQLHRAHMWYHQLRYHIRYHIWKEDWGYALT